MQVHEIKRSEYMRLLENLDWLPTNVECGMYESSVDHEYVVVCMGAGFGKIYKYAPLFRGFDGLADAGDFVTLGESFEYDKLHESSGKVPVIFQYEIWHVLDNDPDDVVPSSERILKPSEPFRLWRLLNGTYTVDNWHRRLGQQCKDLGLYTAKQMKHPHFVYLGIWPDHNNIVFAWCRNEYTGRLEKCKIVRCNRRLKMVTTYGEDVAVLVHYVDVDDFTALAQLLAAEVM